MPSPAWPAAWWWGAIALAVGCGSGGAGTTTPVCTPACPIGTRCSDRGCLAEAAPPDLSVTPAVDGDGGAGCVPTCQGATPHCSPAGQCVPCLLDGDCPLGQRCRASGAGFACLVGCTSDSRCAATDGGASARCCDGACVDVGSDPDHCGACGHRCAAIHARARCSGGQCGPLSCTPPYADCAHPGAACDTDLSVDEANCGACGRRCAPAHARGGCAHGCYLAACDFGWGDCNGDPADGCEQGLLVDARNCGQCGRACARAPHATVGCDQGACRLAGCDPGWADCDGDPGNGCEVQTDTDRNHCGGCNTVCPLALVCKNGGCTFPACDFANATSRCEKNVCVLGACLPGFADCNHLDKDGCEVNLQADPMNCGACGAACPRAMPQCTLGACSACLGGLDNVGAGDFTITFTIQTADGGFATVLGQRGICAHDHMWDVRASGGSLGFELDDLVNYTSLSTVRRISDNKPHTVVAQRVGGTVTVTIDNVLDSQAAAAAVFGALTPLYIAKGDPCEGQDGTAPLNGTVTSVCLTAP